MDLAWADYLKRMKEAPDAALEWSRSGIEYLRSSIGSLPFFAATSVDSGSANPGRDETHYFLVPDPRQDGGFALVERRRLPEGTGAVNSLPKVRIFHVHDPAAVEVLEDRLMKRMVSAAEDAPGLEHDLALRLEAMGEEIDKQSHWVTGGLIVVGGVVAIANPLLGIGIAAKSLLPELGGKLAKFGFGAAAETMRRFSGSIRESQARKKAESEVKRMKPELVVDPVLAFLDRTVARGADGDPVVEELNGLPDWWLDRDQRLTMGVVAEIWKDGRWGDWARGIGRRLEVLPA
ncbi:hypothetical protein [Luteolibacter marinus]|uniref:hypothetical protein n=1 Tax=Luteolibacter marinus TaxID=2776705 RepID=UPI0018662FB1|nr:hypothetical protein [Luteolibacter marinus]